MNKLVLFIAFIVLASAAKECGKGIASCTKRYNSNYCCSRWGYCGTSSAYCGAGASQCQCDCKGSKACMDTSSTPATTKCTSANLNVRKGPSTSYAVVKTLAKGSSVSYTKTENDWANIGSNQWVSMKYLTSCTPVPQPQPEPTPSGTTMYVTADSLNVRSGDNTNAPRIRSISYCTKVTALGYNSDKSWTRIGNNEWVSSKYLTSDAKACTVSPGLNRDNIVSIARSKLGSDYVWGAQGPNSFDCSGFVYWVFKTAGMSISRTTANEFYKRGTSISRGSIQKGDVVYFDWDNDGRKDHIGIVTSYDSYIHASGSQTKQYARNGHMVKENPFSSYHLQHAYFRRWL